MKLKITLTIKEPLIIDVDVNKEDWENAATDSRNLFIKDKITEHLGWNMDELIQGSDLKIDVITS